MRLELTEFGIKVTTIQPGKVQSDFSVVKHKRDVEKAQKEYEGFEPLKPLDIAESISYCVNLPDRITIAELFIMTKAQSGARTIFKNGVA